MSADSRRLVRDVLTEHARGDDPALAAAARAELQWRRQQDMQTFTDAARRIADTYRSMARTLVDASAPMAAFMRGFAGTYATPEEHTP